MTLTNVFWERFEILWRTKQRDGVSACGRFGVGVLAAAKFFCGRSLKFEVQSSTLQAAGLAMCHA
jgi:hypothetical protein